MNDKQKRLQEVYDHLRNHHGIHTQTDFAQSVNYSRNAISLALNGNEGYLSDKLFRNICAAYPNIFNLDYLLTGKGDLLTVEEDVKSSRIENQQTEIPDFVQRLFDEATRMATRNEMLERQSEKLIAELRDTKNKNESFLSELKKSKEDNDALVAELRISRAQNDNLISELRETKKNNAMLSKKLDSAIDGIEGMKAQLTMMAGAYAEQSPAFPPTYVNDDGTIESVIRFPIPNTLSGKKGVRVDVIPEGLIRGGYTAITEELAATAAQLLKKSESKPKRK